MSPDTPPPPPPPFSNPSTFNPAAPLPAGPPKTSGAALASFLLGLASLVCLCVTAIPAIICGIVGLSNIGKSNGQLKGKGLAILGIILSLLLTIVGAAGWTAFAGKGLKDNPMWMELLGAGKAMMESATTGQTIATALKAHAEANQGKLPSSLEELVAAGSLDASSLDHPVDGTPGFWQLTQPGAVLADLPPRTVIARGGPIVVQNESMEVVIYANGTVEPREMSGAALPEEVPTGTEPAPDSAIPDPVESPTPSEQ